MSEVRAELYLSFVAGAIQKESDMKRLLPGIVLFFALVSSAHAQIAQTAANSVRSQAIIPKAVGNTLLVQCDYNGPAPINAAISDSIGTVYTSIGVINANSNRAQFVSISAALTSLSSRTVRCPAAPTGTTFGEIYIVELTGGMSVDGEAQANGAGTPALVTVPATTGDIVVAFCVQEPARYPRVGHRFRLSTTIWLHGENPPPRVY